MQSTCLYCLRNAARPRTAALRSVKPFARRMASTRPQTRPTTADITPNKPEEHGVTQNSMPKLDPSTLSRPSRRENAAESSVELIGTTPLPNERWIPAWTSIGVPEIIVRRLLTTYPHIEAPTPAQRAFILSVFAGKDVYLRDHMGRGKTLAISIAVISLAYNSQMASSSNRPINHEIIVLFPSSHLLHQVERDMLLLDPSILLHDRPSSPPHTRPKLFTILATTDKGGKKSSLKKDRHRNRHLILEKPKFETPSQPIPPAAVLLATPKDFVSQNESIDIGSVKTLFIDEADTILPPLPGRFLPAFLVARSSVNRHPPPLVRAINYILNIKDTREQPKLHHYTPGERRAKQKLPPPSEDEMIDLSQRKPIQTIWTSGTLTTRLKWFAQKRGWVRSGTELRDLDFTPKATKQQVQVRHEALQLDSAATNVDDFTTSAFANQPDHYALVINPEDGTIHQLQDCTDRPREEETDQRSKEDQGKIEASILEALALLHTAQPPPIGTYALALCPEGVSLDQLQKDLQSFGIGSLYLHPENIQDMSILESATGSGIESDDADKKELPPIFLTRRSVVAGLHLPSLHTVYLVNGLDVNHSTSGQSVLDKLSFYDIAAGRVGRLGTPTSINPDGSKQRVVSLVSKGTRNERVLSELFFGRYSVRPEDEKALKEGKPVEKMRRLAEWDEQEFKKTVLELMG